MGSYEYKKYVRFLLPLLLLLILSIWVITRDPNLPPLKDGDLIFQTSTSTQSKAILVATASAYTHVGLLKKQGDAWVVIEAVAHVKETPLTEWIDRGLFKRVAIYRDSQLSAAQTQQIFSAATHLYGKPYNPFFSFDDNGIYCSELPYLAYKAAGIPIGEIQKVADLNIDNILVKKLIAQRWQRYPACQMRHYDFEACYRYILAQPLITPASLARDGQFEKIYSNYLFY